MTGRPGGRFLLPAGDGTWQPLLPRPAADHAGHISELAGEIGIPHSRPMVFEIHFLGLMTVKISCAVSSAIRIAVGSLLLGVLLGLVLAAQFAPVPGS